MTSSWRISDLDPARREVANAWRIVAMKLFTSIFGRRDKLFRPRL
jgi:hypothetical protein